MFVKTMSERSKNNRLLSFESLETRKGLTTVVGVDSAVAWDDGFAGEFSTARTAANHLLLYVDTLADIHVERAIPHQAAADVIDETIGSTSPTSHSQSE